MRVTGGRVFAEGAFRSCDLGTDGSRIAWVGGPAATGAAPAAGAAPVAGGDSATDAVPASGKAPAADAPATATDAVPAIAVAPPFPEKVEKVLDASGCFVIPGLIDLHFHGCVGHDFCEGTDEAIHAIARYEASRGVTSICPATMTFPEDVLGPVMDAARAFSPADDEASLVGINMEGPFISPNKVGAQNPAHVVSCDIDLFDRLQRRAGGLIKIVDVAPEEPGALEFIRARSGTVRVSVAHTCADYDQARRAFDEGCNHVTHVCNAMPPLHHRDPSVIGAAHDSSHVMVELICDGVHVHPAMTRALLALFGDERIVLISDTMEAAGLEDGRYSLGGQAVTVQGNRATLESGTIAGGVTDLAACLRVAVREAGVPLEGAVRMAAENPARALGIDGECGSLAPGKAADIVVLDEDLQVKHVIVRGKLIR